MPIEDVFSIKGRGTVATGRIEQGTLNLNDEVEIVGVRATQKSVVTGIEAFKKSQAKLFIHISSLAALEEFESIKPIEENDICNPTSFYGKSKRCR